jgi:membrane fusion protein (multidrug efflux system)
MNADTCWALLLTLFAAAAAPAVAGDISEGTPSKPTTASQAATIPVTPVVARRVQREIELPSELWAFRNVALYSRVHGFVERIGVDRGSRVRHGDVLIKVVAPELTAQRFEAEAKWQSTRAQALEAEAKHAGDLSTYRHLKAASRTPGVVPANDVEVAQKTAAASEARVNSWRSQEAAARQSMAIQKQMESYLEIVAPFDGVITERNVHEGSLVGPSTGLNSAPLLRIQQLNPLRLIVPVPEANVASIRPEAILGFSVPAYPERTFTGVVRRNAHALDPKTRTMPVELDVENRSEELAPGMYAQVKWRSQRPDPSLQVPVSAIVTTTERTFVIAIRNGRAEWVDVRRGTGMGDQVEIFGKLHAGESVVYRATDELRDGTPVVPATTAH